LSRAAKHVQLPNFRLIMSSVFRGLTFIAARDASVTWCKCRYYRW